MARSGTSKRNINGQVILPLPELIHAMACRNLKVNDEDFRKSLYAPAFGMLMSDISNKLTLNKDEQGKWIWNSKVWDFMGYARFDSFTTYHIIPCQEKVDFVLHDKVFNDNWYRPFDFDIYQQDFVPNALKEKLMKDWNYEKDIIQTKMFVNRDTRLEYIGIDDKWFDINTLVGNELVTTVAMNVSTTNAFMHKFGVQITNSSRQKIIDQSLRFFENYSNRDSHQNGY